MDDQPFLGMQAIRSGQVTDHRLRTKYRAVYRNVYLARDTALTAELRARAAWMWAGPEAVLVGTSAAAVLGAKWLDGSAPAELVRADRHSPAGIRVRSYTLDPDDVRRRRGMLVTTAARTAFDIGRILSLHRAIPVMDALMNATGVKPADVMTLAERRPGVRGVRRLKAVLDNADGGAESPQESRLRMVLVGAGLPKPETQIEFFDEYGEAYIRVDMGWRQWQVAVEYDGVQHWSDSKQRSWDIERIALLEAIGWVVVRVSAEMLRRPGAVVDRVRAKLRASGCPI